MGKSSIERGQFLRFRTVAGVFQSYNVQNYFINKQYALGGVTFDFAQFYFAYGRGSIGGSRSTTSIAIENNAVTRGIARAAENERWMAQVTTVEFDLETRAVLQTLSSELWRVSKIRGDGTILSIILKSPLDAVKGNIPRGRLSTYQVGALPTTGVVSL